MEALIQLLSDSVRGMQADIAVITENYRAMETMGEDIVAIIEAKEATYV